VEVAQGDGSCVGGGGRALGGDGTDHGRAKVEGMRGGTTQG
jgi:hypothetical protein